MRTPVRTYVAFLLLLPAAVVAHPTIDDQLANLTALSAADPNNATLLLQLGDLHRRRAEWDPAVSFYQRAARFPGARDAADLGRAQLLLERAEPDGACLVLDPYIARHPDHARAWALRARARTDLGNPLGAADDYHHAIVLTPNPPPDYYLDAARALVMAAHDDAGLQTLDDGAARLGAVAVFALEAIDIEVRRQRYDAALRRLDQLLARSPGHPEWLARRAEVLELAGRYTEARQALGATLQALEIRPIERKHTRASTNLEAQVRESLQRLEMRAGLASSSQKGAAPR